MVKVKSLNIDTFTIRGLSKDLKKQKLSRVLEKLKVNTCCLQETKIKKRVDTLVRKDHLVWLESDVLHCGVSFMITKKWCQNIYKYWKRHDLIGIIQLIQNPQKQTNKFNIVTIINEHAPQTQLLKNDKTELHQMYNELCTPPQNVQNSQFYFCSWQV